MLGRVKLDPHVRFWSKVQVSEGCWNWQAVKDKRGYGRYGVTINGKGVPRFAHRIGWELLFGPIPLGMELCHKCNNPSCVRTDHLYVGTRKQNAEQAARDGLMLKGETHRLGSLKCCQTCGGKFTTIYPKNKPQGVRRCAACSLRRDRENYAKKKVKC